MRRVTCLAFAAAVAATLSGTGHAGAEKVWRPVQVISGLRSEGMRIGLTRYYTPTTDPNKLLGRPGQYRGKATFRDRRVKGETELAVDAGGSVETFASKSDAKRRYDFVSALGKTALFAEYDYLEGTVLLRVSHNLTPAQAKAYERALRKVV
jgi:hypothetical protein